MKIRVAYLVAVSIFVLTCVRGYAQGGGPINSLQERVNALQAQVNALQANVAKLNGQISASDLVGTYTWVYFQNEITVQTFIDAPSIPSVGSHVLKGTATFAADGTLLFAGTEAGFKLSEQLGFWTVSPVGPHQGQVPATWSYDNGFVTITSSPTESGRLSVAAGGRVLVAVDAKASDQTTTLLLLTRLN